MILFIQIVQSSTSYSFFWTSTQSLSCSMQRVTLRTGRDLRGGCGEITTDCSFNLALLTEPHVEHCTSWTFDSSQRLASIGVLTWLSRFCSRSSALASMISRSECP